MVIKKLCTDWQSSGIELGDVVLLHSSVKRTLQKNRKIVSAKISIDDILDSFLEAIGSKGTLLIPLFNFGFASGEVFSYHDTQSQMGKLTEVARRRQGAVRTGHPIYSFAAIGNLSRDFESVDNFSGYGKDSPFGLLTQLDGKIATLNVPDNQCMTFYHHVEEMCSVDYRYHKTFTGPYIDKKGVMTNRTYGLFVRNLDRGVVTNVTGMEDLLWKKGLCKGYRFDQGTGLKVVNARDVFSETADVIRKNQAHGLLYKIEK